MLDKLHNASSHHGLDLVAYMYGEMDDAARDRFESHLAACDECAVELGGYADARLGVIEWRRNDFEPLATPAIIIPDTQSVTTLVAERPRRSWTDWIGSIAALPAMARAGIGLAAAALLIGILYFALAPGRLDNGGQSIATVPAPSADQPVSFPELAIPEQAAVGKEAEIGTPRMASDDRPRTVVRSSERPQRAALRQTPASRNYHRIGPLEAVTLTPSSRTSPRLNTFEEEEDTTLRLSDLFSQVGQRKK